MFGIVHPKAVDCIVTLIDEAMQHTNDLSFERREGFRSLRFDQILVQRDQAIFSKAAT